jgi:hypothetical protein
VGVVGAADEEEGAVGDGVGDVLDAGPPDLEGEGGQFVLADLLACVPFGDPCAEQVASGLSAAQGDEAGEQRVDVVDGRVELRVPGVGDHGRGPFGQRGAVGGGDAEQAGGDGQGQRYGEVGDHVGRPARGQASGQVGGDRPYALAPGFGPAGGEGRGGETPQSAVRVCVPGQQVVAQRPGQQKAAVSLAGGRAGPVHGQAGIRECTPHVPLASQEPERRSVHTP